jgi:hypothetical protein
MKSNGKRTLVGVLLFSALAAGCASTSGGDSDEGGRRDLLTREEIVSVPVNNLYDLINRLRPRWLQVRSNRSFSMETEIAVLQNDVYLGPAGEALRQMSPELAFEIRYLEGARAATAIPGLMSGRHIEAAIIVSTRPHGGG